MTNGMALARDHTGTPVAGDLGRARPLAYAAVVLVVFVTTVIVLAVKAGTGTAMFTTLVAIIVAGTVCGLWGTALAMRSTGRGGDTTAG